MITTNDMIKFSKFIREDFGTVFATKEEMNAGFEAMNKKFSQLQASVDGILSMAKDHPQEIAVVGGRVDNVEKWVEKAASKIGIKYNT